MRSIAVASALLALYCSVSSAQEVPLQNWTVPPYRTSGASGGMTTMVDVTPGIGFVGIQPCRVADTRGNGAPITGGIFANSEARNWTVWGICGIPSGADAISVNFSVVSAPATPAGAFLLAWPTGQAPPPTAIMTYGPGVTVISNAAIVPLNASGQIRVNVSHSTHIIMDVNGYFTNQYNPGVSFHAVSSTAAPAILAENTSTASEAVAVRAVITTTTPGPTGVAAVQGFNQGTNATGVGVWGKHNGAGWGVLGESTSGFGVVATTGGNLPNAAVWARNTSTAENVSGVYGSVTSQDLIPSHYSYGVFGEATGPGGTGVFGSSPARGVWGTARNSAFIAPTAVRGDLLSDQGGTVVAGYLGFRTGGVSYGAYSAGPAHVGGVFTATTKNFVQPHPLAPDKEIRYVSLEGPQSEVYFRGTTQVAQGVTRIAIPDHFRMVAAAGTYSALVTPVGAMATVAVLSKGEAGIVIQASRDVMVDYVVYAVREATRQESPIVENVHFRPDPERDVTRHLPDAYRQLMIQNGTLNPDGTVNVETARRLGWDKEWVKRAKPAPQPTPE